MRQPLIGACLVVLAGFLNASFAIPMRYNRHWKWENTWSVFSVFSLSIFPTLLVLLIVKRATELFVSLSLKDVLPALVFGFIWGIAQVTFGVSINLLGVSVALPIVSAIAIVLGAFTPVIVRHPEALTGRLGLILATSAVLLVASLLLYARAASMREKASLATKSTTGLVLAIFTGVTGGMINVGFALSEGIVRRSQLLGNGTIASTYPVWAVLLAAGFLPNLIYCAYLIRKNRTGFLFVSPGYLGDLLRSTAMAVFWILATTLYGLSTTFLGKFGTAVGYLSYGSFTVLFANVLGWKVGEWANASPQALRNFWAGMGLVLASIGTLALAA
jgi:L-rhamnose-H+ transport protein